ncbi:MAG: SDR family oxidoreductase [Myxococcales bacterium]|nr:SDR family oxidoreductase [Myxococcales bacterium]MCB9643449.1 SDR family oxidoreductase [Myxococcales bacterium]
MRVLIAGCGYVGSALAQELVQAGHTVWGLRRDPQGLPEGVLPMAADLTRPETLQDLPAALDIVVYAASSGGRKEENYRAAYVDGVRCLLEALEPQKTSLKRVLFTSSTSVYAQQDGSWIDEDSPAEASGFTGAFLREGEQILWSWGVPAVVLRLAGIYGPGRFRLIEQVARGEARCPAGEARYSNRIHRDDCAGALHHLMMLPDVQPLYLGVDAAPVELCEVQRWLAEQMGFPHPPVVSDDEAPHPLRGNKRCRGARLLESGYTLRYPSYQDGYKGILQEWMQKNAASVERG